MTRLLFKVILLQLISWLFVPSLAHAENNGIQGNQKQLRDVQAHIEILRKELTEKEATKSKTADTLRDIESLISSFQHKLLQLKQRQAEISNELARLQQSSEQLNDDLLIRQMQLGKLLYFQNLIQKPDYLALLLKQKNPDEITRKLYYYRYLARSRSRHIDELRDLHAQLVGLAENQAREHDAFKQSQQEYFEQMQLLTQEKTRHAHLLATLSRETSQKHQALSGLMQDEQHLSELVERLNRQLIQKKPSIPEKFSGKPILRNDQLPPATASGGSFASMKGKLRLPVRGELVNRFGSPRERGGVKWNGLFIRAAAGSEVKAIASGRVIFAEWIRGFGNFMILDHGDHYMSLYGHNDALSKRVGEAIRSGDTIAVVGNGGGSSQSGLYFELRYKGKPFDPLTWINSK
ncbi:MAG: peptidoglycan DD-metalloendopeptidase family protein [Nitrosomonas sp.]|nr:peptidoglycan DD-metalloendopeptidase family protein [Nitrosomonas sp.]